MIVALFAIVYTWQEFFNPLIYLKDRENFPLSVGLFTFPLGAREGMVDLDDGGHVHRPADGAVVPVHTALLPARAADERSEMKEIRP